MSLLFPFKYTAFQTKLGNLFGDGALFRQDRGGRLSKFEVWAKQADDNELTGLALVNLAAALAEIKQKKGLLRKEGEKLVMQAAAVVQAELDRRGLKPVPFSGQFGED